MILRRYLFALFALFVIHIDQSYGTDEDDIDKIVKEQQKNTDKLRQMYDELKKDKKQLEADREKFNNEKELNRNIYENDVIHLNVGGEIIATTRQTLISLRKSLFSILFNGRWEQRLHYDDQENIFLDFNPTVFRHLLDQLQLNEGKNMCPPSDFSLIRSFEKMMRKLHVEHLLSISDRNILTVNVDGQLITTHLSNPFKLTNKTHVFIDYHPKMFRHFIQVNRQNKSFSISTDKNNSFVMKQTLKQHNNQFELLNISFTKEVLQIKQSFTTKFDELLKRTLLLLRLKANLKWKPNATTIAGSNQFLSPHGIYVDQQQKSVSVYIADWRNHRIFKWNLDENKGETIAGGNGERNRIDQLNGPSDVIVDKNNRSLIICDQGNRRVIRWSLENQQEKQILITNITCFALRMNECEDLFVSDIEKHEVKRWRKGEYEAEGTVVAGGHGKGHKLNQLNWPSFLFIDREESVYVSDRNNHRVMKWLKGAKEGIIVAGGQGQGNHFKQLNEPMGLLVNEIGDIYVADSGNDRIMYWPFGSIEGQVVVGGNGQGQRSNQFHYPTGLSFDVENNLYVVDSLNHRVQRYSVDRNDK